MGFREAALSLGAREEPEDNGRMRVCPLDPRQDDPGLMSQVIDYYHETLVRSEEALAYLEKRGIRDQ